MQNRGKNERGMEEREEKKETAHSLTTMTQLLLIHMHV